MEFTFLFDVVLFFVDLLKPFEDDLKIMRKAHM